MTNARAIVTFLEETVKRDDVPGRLRKIVVAHVIKGNKLGDEIRAVTVPEKPDEDWIASTAAKIAEHGASESVTLGAGIQRYAVQAFFEGDEKPHGRHVFTCEGPDPELGDAIGTEGPDAEGLTAASMRHAEFAFSWGSRTAAQTQKDLRDEVASLRRENAELRRDQLASFKAMEAIYSEQHRRELELRASAVKTKMLEDAGEKFGLLLPLAINHMAGKKVLPETSSDTLLLKSFADSISREQLQQLGGVLRGEQLASFIRIMTSVSTPAPDVAGQAPAATAPHVNGAAAT